MLFIKENPSLEHFKISRTFFIFMINFYNLVGGVIISRISMIFVSFFVLCFCRISMIFVSVFVFCRISMIFVFVFCFF